MSRLKVGLRRRRPRVVDEVFYGFDENDYLDFAQWLQDALRYIKSQNAVVDAYENEALAHNAAIKKVKNEESTPENTPFLPENDLGKK